MNPILVRCLGLVVAMAGLVPLPVQALEYPIGAPQNVAGMEVAAVYLQAIDMEPEGHMRRAAESDIQWIRRPGGDGSAPAVTVAGLRTKVGF